MSVGIYGSKNITKPLAVCDYNIHIGGAVVKDHCWKKTKVSSGM
jgi:hypothetical protein